MTFDFYVGMFIGICLGVAFSLALSLYCAWERDRARIKYLEADRE